MIKEKISSVSQKAKSFIDAKTVGFAMGISTPFLVFATESSGSRNLINTTGVNFMDVLNEMVALVPVVLPVIVGCLAFRKGFSFLKSAIKGA